MFTELVSSNALIKFVTLFLIYSKASQSASCLQILLKFMGYFLSAVYATRHIPLSSLTTVKFFGGVQTLTHLMMQSFHLIVSLCPLDSNIHRNQSSGLKGFMSQKTNHSIQLCEHLTHFPEPCSQTTEIHVLSLLRVMGFHTHRKQEVQL